MGIAQVPFPIHSIHLSYTLTNSNPTSAEGLADLQKQLDLK